MRTAPRGLTDVGERLDVVLIDFACTGTTSSFEWVFHAGDSYSCGDMRIFNEI